jgi:hypothetical protein
MPATVSLPLRYAVMRTPVERYDARLVVILVENRNEGTGLENLIVVIVATEVNWQTVRDAAFTGIEVEIRVVRSLPVPGL